MLLEVTINGQPPSAAFPVSEGMFWYLRSAFEKFAKETGIVIDIDGEAEIEDGCLLELFLTLEPITDEARVSSLESLDEVGLDEARSQITMYQTPREEGLAMIEGVMTRANEAYNEGKAMRIRGIEENQDGEQAVHGNTH
jgi:hypothetical protein